MRPAVMQALSALKRQGISEKMTAYSILARKVGRSSDWIRRVVRRDNSINIRLADWISIQCLIEKLEASNLKLQDEINQLRENTNASCENDPAGLATRNTASGTGSPAQKRTVSR